MLKCTRRVITTVLLVIFAAGAADAQFRPGGEVAFDEGRNALDIPFELNSDKMYLRVKINDGGPYWLVLDTGSPGMILDTRVAEELGVETDEPVRVGGAGENPFMLANAKAKFDAVLPGIRLLDQPARVGGIDAVVGPFEGRRIDGVLGGYNVFSEFIVEIDYTAQTINIRDRDGYAPRAGGTVVPVSIEGGHCAVEATAVLLDGATLTGQFMLDTGLRGTMVFNSPFVNEHDLLNRCGRTVYTTTGGGVGGQVKTHVGRLDDFVFGGFSLGVIHASLSQLSYGALANEARAGIIGAAVLQRFRVVFDYAGERLILYEQEHNAERLDFDKSGMFLVSDADDRSVYRVIDVIDGAAAYEAGLRIGDVIMSIDGKPAGEVTLEQARRLFRRKSGTRYLIAYDRGGRLSTAELTLRKVM
jgi:hypothetical protein